MKKVLLPNGDKKLDNINIKESSSIKVDSKIINIVLSNNNARQLLEKRLITQGMSKSDAKTRAKDWVESFDGPIMAKTLSENSNLLLTHSLNGKASGNFTTFESAGKTPYDRQVNLALPKGNTAEVETKVVVKETHIGLIGKVKGQENKEFSHPHATGGFENQVIPDRRKIVIEYKNKKVEDLISNLKIGNTDLRDNSFIEVKDKASKNRDEYILGKAHEASENSHWKQYKIKGPKQTVKKSEERAKLNRELNKYDNYKGELFDDIKGFLVD